MCVLEQYLDQNKMYSMEGDSGVRKFEQLIRDVGEYSSIHDFLVDNPGAIHAMMEFIGKWVDRNSEWEENLKRIVELNED